MYLGLFQLLDDITLSGSDKGCGFHQPQDHIHVAQRPFRGAQHVVPEFVFGAVDSRCIQEYNLTVRSRINRLNTVSGGLGLSGSDGNLLPHQTVNEGGFPHIGPADQRGEAGAEVLSRPGSRFRTLSRHLRLSAASMFCKICVKIHFKPHSGA